MLKDMFSIVVIITFSNFTKRRFEIVSRSKMCDQEIYSALVEAFSCCLSTCEEGYSLILSSRVYSVSINKPY